MNGQFLKKWTIFKNELKQNPIPNVAQINRKISKISFLPSFISNNLWN